MRKSLMVAALLGTFAAPAAVMAEDAAPAAEATSPHTFSYNVGLYSQYIFRGLTQTARQPALQGGVDYSHSSGFYAGMWGSNISWLQDAGAYQNSSLEVDVYGGYKNMFGDSGISYDVGLLQYLYPGSRNPGIKRADTTELYAALGWQWISAKVSTVVSDGAFGVDDGQGTYYAELNATYPIAESGYSILAHVGYQDFSGKAKGLVGTNNDKLFTYTDWKLGLVKAFNNGVNVGGYYTGTDAQKDGYLNDGENLGKDQFTVFVQKTF